MIWLLVPPLRPVLSIPSVPAGSFDFFVSVCGRVVCAVFVSSFSCDVLWRFGVSPSLSSRSSSRLPVSCGRLVAVLSICPSSRIAHRSSSRPAVRFPVLFIVPRCFALSGLSFPVSSALLVKQSAFSRFVWRLVVSGRGVGSCSCVSFFSFLVVYRSLRLMAMAAARHLWSRFARLVVACFFLYCHLSSWGVAMAG